MLELVNVCKRFGELQALETTSLAIQPGETTALLGPSGCGKSTLLRLIVGLLEPDSGHIVFDGTKLTRDNVTDFRHRMGYMIQDGGLFPHLDMKGNVTLLAHYLNWDNRRIDERLTSLADLVHLPLEALNRFPTQVSGGQRQRVALMRALFLDPDVLLLDEPLGALDPVIRAELQTDLRDIFRSLGKTVVVVTHDIGEAGFLADSIALLESGRILQQGTLDALVNSPASKFVTTFVNAQRSPLESLKQSPQN